METFQKRFLKAKDISGLRWIDIAKQSGLDKAQISQYKNGVHEPEQDALHRLASTFKVNVDWLMGYDVPMMRVPDEITSDDLDLINSYHHLNDLGKLEFTRFLDKLLVNPEYKKND